MPQIDRDALVPELGRDILELMPVVARGIVDQRGDRPVLGGHLADRRLIGLHVADVAFDEERTGLPDQRLGGRLVDVDEADLRALRREMLDDRGADARAAAGNEDAAILETWVGGK